MSNPVEKRMNDVRDFLFKFLKQASPKYPVVFDEQHDPRPLGPYVSFKLLTSFVKVGTLDERRWSEADECFYRIGFREFTVSIKATGSAFDGTKSSGVRATSLLADIQWALEDPEHAESFRAAGIGIVEWQNIVDTTELEENIFVPKAVFDVRMSVRVQEALTTGTIEHVVVGGVASSPDGSDHTVDEFTINVP
jgi:hypothetical protein